MCKRTAGTKPDTNSVTSYIWLILIHDLARLTFENRDILLNQLQSGFTLVLPGSSRHHTDFWTLRYGIIWKNGKTLEKDYQLKSLKTTHICNSWKVSWNHLRDINRADWLNTLTMSNEHVLKAKGKLMQLIIKVLPWGVPVLVPLRMLFSAIDCWLKSSHLIMALDKYKQITMYSRITWLSLPERYQTWWILS